MTRLLFAAARGARLQVMSDNNWYGITQIYMPFRRDARAIRTHPDDAHLAYGPISTALREMAESGKAPYTLSGLLAREAYEYEWVYPEASEDHDNYTCLFLLILAEALADEGL